MTETVLNRAQAAAYLGVPTKFLADAAKRGDGPPFVRFSQRTVVYQRADLDRYREKHRVTPKK